MLLELTQTPPRWIISTLIQKHLKVLQDVTQRISATKEAEGIYFWKSGFFPVCRCGPLKELPQLVHESRSRARGSVRRRGGCLRVAPAASSRLRSPDVSPVLRPGWKRLYSSRQPRKPHATGAVLPGRRVGLPRRPRSVQTPRLSCPPTTDAHPQQRAPRVAHTCLGYKWEAPAARSRFHHLLERVPGPGRAAHGRPLVYCEEYFKGRE